MARLGRVLSAAVIAGAGIAWLPSSADAQSVRQPQARSSNAAPAGLTRHAFGSITGTVSDEHGGPLAGARVTAIGETMALAVTDESGRFVTEILPAGEYVLRAHLKGFAASQRTVVRVGGATATAPQLQLRRVDGATGTTGAEPPLASRPIVAAGFQLPAADNPDPAAKDGGDKDTHPHSEMAWRLRHIKRSILKDQSSTVVFTGDDVDPDEGSIFGRALGGATSVASFAGSLFADTPLTGEVNLLTTNAFAPGELFAGDTRTRGVAYFSLGAPTPAGEWLVRAAMTEGDLASWILAGSFTSKAGAQHAYTVGLSYGAQEYQGGNPAALAAMRDGSRHAGELFAFDRWRVAPWFELDYGARYARYGYIREERGLFSPRLGLTLEPVKGTRVTTLLTQRMVVPGAEEFLPRAITGPALPPERTFASIDGQQMRVERVRGIDFLLEHEFRGAYVIGIRRFYQNVDDQLATLFRVAPAGSPQSIGHYYVASAGAFDASGWAVRLSTPAARRLRGSIDYSVTRATWGARTASLASLAPALYRPAAEDIHDVTTSLHTDIPETATRVYVLYRVNSAFTRSGDLGRPGADARFDVQVNQALPFGLAGTQWEVLLGLRNLFRDPSDAASVYDELLVVRPPKRVIGGFLVRF
ncbi:MAG TPA: carboxypeptidase-like regulatory domain-containing protein [Vicinamibacterales bacterium]|nr:carboxypeptidase-like regulatory domain-containing protein [Vicinamibacterales bacterium]